MAVEVHCTAVREGYRCSVRVSEAKSSTQHTVRVTQEDLERWSRGRSPEALVSDSFDFLLERESKESILKEFDLSVIKRYFPEYDGAAKV
jgi:hypothetical protein